MKIWIFQASSYSTFEPVSVHSSKETAMEAAEKWLEEENTVGSEWEPLNKDDGVKLRYTTSYGNAHAVRVYQMRVEN